MGTYHKSTIKQYERGAVLSFKDSQGNVCEINDSERQRTITYTRVMGYFAPTELYNLGKKAEFEERVWFKMPVEVTEEAE